MIDIIFPKNDFEVVVCLLWHLPGKLESARIALVIVEKGTNRACRKARAVDLTLT